MIDPKVIERIKAVLKDCGLEAAVDCDHRGNRVVIRDIRAKWLLVTCTFCGLANPGGAKFCERCGQPLSIRQPHHFCPACGEALTPENIKRNPKTGQAECAGCWSPIGSAAAVDTGQQAEGRLPSGTHG